MNKSRHEIQKHNHELLATLTERVGDIVDHQPGACPYALVNFLKNRMLPHAIGEERHFYPALENLVKEHGQATATMRIDHEYIEGYIDWIEETVQELETADDDEKPQLQTLLERLCLQLEAVLQLHMAKEERVYLPLFERYLPEQEQAEILDRMHKVDEELPLETGREPLYDHALIVS